MYTYEGKLFFGGIRTKIECFRTKIECFWELGKYFCVVVFRAAYLKS